MLVDSNFRIQSLERDAAKREFFDILKCYGYDMYDVDEESKLPKCLLPIIVKKDLNSFIEFNGVLEAINTKHEISVIDICTYLMEDFFEADQLLTLLQTNMYDALYLELRKKNFDKNIDKFSKFLKK